MSKIEVGSAALHYRSLQKQHIKSIHRYGILTRRQQITLTPKAMAGENSVPIMEQSYSIAIRSDASRLGWAGGSLSRERTGSHWSIEEKQAHMNVLELKAAHLAIQSYLKKVNFLDSVSSCRWTTRQLWLTSTNGEEPLTQLLWKIGNYANLAR